MTSSQYMRRDDVSAKDLRRELRQRLRRGLSAPRLKRRFVEQMLEELVSVGGLKRWAAESWRNLLRGVEDRYSDYRRVLVRLIQRHKESVA